MFWGYLDEGHTFIPLSSPPFVLMMDHRHCIERRKCTTAAVLPPQMLEAQTPGNVPATCCEVAALSTKEAISGSTQTMEVL